MKSFFDVARDFISDFVRQYIYTITQSVASSSKNSTTGIGFKPTHGDRIGLAVQRRNHSATLSDKASLLLQFELVRCFSFELMKSFLMLHAISLAILSANIFIP